MLYWFIKYLKKIIFFLNTAFIKTTKAVKYTGTSHQLTYKDEDKILFPLIIGIIFVLFILPVADS